MKKPGCELCEHTETAAWSLVFADARLRVVRVLDAPEFPAFYRVIWNDHVAELSDLAVADRAHLMNAVVAVERVLREALNPSKINLAALGNMVPHLHWHVIARFDWDSHFPQPIWGTRQRTPEPAAVARMAVALSELDARVRAALAA
jgi:diadenosine tetraphosphate (Ap4A) HIT family hydrolase